MGRLFYFIREALRGFFRAKLMTFVSVVTVAVSLFIVGVAVLGVWNMRHWLAQIEQRADMVAYVRDAVAADSAALGKLAARVREFPQIEAVEVVDKGQAWERFKRMYGAEMLEMVDDNPLPASLEIALRSGQDSPDEIRQMTRELSILDGIESTDFSAAQAIQIRRLKRWAWLAGIFTGVLAIGVLYYVVANTIKLTIYARADLVVNMRFVGATDLFIATPFVLEGMLQGLAGSLGAVAGLHLLRIVLGSGGSIVFIDPTTFALIIAGTGVLFAWLGSVIAVRKFLV